MNDVFARDWQAAKTRLLTRWDQLTAGDIAAIDGDVDYLGAALRQRYGWDEERVRREVDALLASLARGDGHRDLAAQARAALQPGAEKVREGLREIGAGLRHLASETFSEGRDRVADATAPMRASAQSHASELGERAAQLVARTERFVHERPLASLGIAVLAGYLLFGRRR